MRFLAFLLTTIFCFYGGRCGCMLARKAAEINAVQLDLMSLMTFGIFGTLGGCLVALFIIKFFVSKEGG